MMNDYMFFHGYGMGFGWIIPIVFIVIFVYFIKSLSNNNESAREILDKKYANGKIDEKEYLKMKKLLEN